MSPRAPLAALVVLLVFGGCGSPAEPGAGAARTQATSGFTWVLPETGVPIPGRMSEDEGLALTCAGLELYVDHSPWADAPAPGRLPGREVRRERIVLDARDALVVTHDLDAPATELPKRLVMHVAPVGPRSRQLVVTSHARDDEARARARTIFESVRFTDD